MLALERADGSSARRPAELRRLRLNLLGGPARLDDNGQAVISTSLVRIGDPDAAGAQPTLTPVRRRHPVDQSVGGLLAPSLSPSSRPAACKRGHTAGGDG